MSDNEQELDAALDTALKLGYRLIDTGNKQVNELLLSNILLKFSMDLSKWKSYWKSDKSMVKSW